MPAVRGNFAGGMDMERMSVVVLMAVLVHQARMVVFVLMAFLMSNRAPPSMTGRASRNAGARGSRNRTKASIMPMKGALLKSALAARRPQVAESEDEEHNAQAMLTPPSSNARSMTAGAGNACPVTSARITENVPAPSPFQATMTRDCGPKCSA